jgi:hypothetical protein
MQVFINPDVASLKEHHHVFSGWGCYNDNALDNLYGGIECKGVDALAGDYVPLLDCFVDKDKKLSTMKEIWECKPNRRATIPQPFKAGQK